MAVAACAGVVEFPYAFTSLKSAAECALVSGGGAGGTNCEGQRVGEVVGRPPSEDVVGDRLPPAQAARDRLAVRVIADRGERRRKLRVEHPTLCREERNER